MNRDTIIFLIFIAVFGAVNLYLMDSGKLAVDWGGVGTVLAAGITLALYSSLYKDNPLFKVAEHLYVGVVAAYELAQVWYQNILADVINPLVESSPDGKSKWLVLVPTVLGLFLMTRFIGKGIWLSRLSFAFIVGLGAGLAIPRKIASFILQQIGPSLLPLWSGPSGLTWGTLDTLLVLVGVVSVLVYFSFSVEHKGVVGGVSRVGIWFLMISFGASFGYTVMARLSLLIGRVSFLLEKWLQVVG